MTVSPSPDLQQRLAAALSGRYTIEGEVGRGGMATVYRAEDLKHRRPVAVKILHPHIAAHLGSERFLREIQIAARLSHPHILSLIDSGQADGLLGYVCFWVVFEEFRLMTLAVEPSARRRGLGRTLLRHAMDLGRAQGATRGLLEVRASNAAALALYAQEGFRQTAVRPRYYVNPVEDAVLMERELSAGTA